MLNFDEFRAVNKRDKAKLLSETTGTVGAKPSKVSKNSSKVEKTKFVSDLFDENMKPVAPKVQSFLSTILDSTGEFLELHHMQGLYILLLLMDTFAALAEVYLNQLPNKHLLLLFSKSFVLKAIKSFATFILLFSACEIFAVFVVFQSQALGHFGYILDLIIIAYQAYCELEGYGKLSKLLNVVRLWRLFRLFNSMVLVEKLLHQETRTALDAAEELLQQYQSDIVAAHEELSKESDARRSVEEMLQSYKDEVDTLNEALKIAAMDIAEVAQADGVDDDYLDDDGEEQDESSAADTHGSISSTSASGTRSAGFEDALSSKYGRNSNKGNIMRAVMDDNVRRMTGTNTSQSHLSGGNGGAFVVHENGTFEQR